MITFLSSAKPFRGRTPILQRNAIRSWQLACPGAEVILFGRDMGTDQIAAEFELRHFADVPTTDLGTPRLDAIFAMGQAEARNDIICYINADIVVLPDFSETIGRVASRWSDMLMIGHRWDIAFDDPIDFEPGWDRKVRSRLLEHGRRSTSDALDFFVFRRGSISGMPAFAIGRPAWDNWLIMHARRTGKRIVDASACVRVMHPDHDYSHVPKAVGRAWEGPEADRNRALALADRPGFKPYLYTIRNANWLVHASGFKRAATWPHLVWRVYVVLEEHGVTDALHRTPIFQRRGAGRIIRSTARVFIPSPGARRFVRWIFEAAFILVTQPRRGYRLLVKRVTQIKQGVAGRLPWSKRL